MVEWQLLIPDECLDDTLTSIHDSRVVAKGKDFRVILSKIKDSSLGLVVTDPPWPYDAKPNTFLRSVSSYKASVLQPYPTLKPEEFAELFCLIHAKLKMNRNCWVWSDWYNVPRVISYARKAGFKYFALLAAKRKRSGMGFYVRKSCYFVIGLSKGKPQVRGFLEEFLGEFDFAGSYKPWVTTVLLIRHSLPPGERWLDPFPATHTEVPVQLRAGQLADLRLLYKRPFKKKSGDIV